MCDEHVSVGSTNSLHLHSLQPETVMEITMTYELENLANKTFRDEEFIQFQKEEMFLDLEDLSDFRPIGEVLKQMSFNFYS